MKKIISTCIGGRSFSLDEDAYGRLEQYLGNFRNALESGDGFDEAQNKEIMDDIEARVAELITERTPHSGMTASIEIINGIAAHLGMPDGSDEPSEALNEENHDEAGSRSDKEKMPKDRVQDGQPSDTPKKLYRDPDNHLLGGICSGMGHYLKCDANLLRILAVITVIPFGILLHFVFHIGGCMTVPFVYLIMWIVIPKASTPAEKCMMRGIPVTAENMCKFY